MRKITYNKLIRDLIPEMIQDSGKRFEIVFLSEEDYKEALRDKLVEEAEEVKNSSDNELIKELADLLEVIDAIKAIYAIESEQINEVKRRRLIDRGGFNKRLKLIWSEDKEEI